MLIKIALFGNQLPDAADNWVAVLDTNTGLVWKAAGGCEYCSG